MVRGGDRQRGCSLPTSDDTRTREPATAAVVSRLGYRPQLDGVRGVAILLVMLVHVHNWPRGGFIGVDVFFTLSGFLITTLLLEEWQARHGVVAPFLRAPSSPALPAVIVLLVAYLIFVILAGSAYFETRLAGIGMESRMSRTGPKPTGWRSPNRRSASCGRWRSRSSSTSYGQVCSFSPFSLAGCHRAG